MNWNLKDWILKISVYLKSFGFPIDSTVQRFLVQLPRMKCESGGREQILWFGKQQCGERNSVTTKKTAINIEPSIKNIDSRGEVRLKCYIKTYKSSKTRYLITARAAKDSEKNIQFISSGSSVWAHLEIRLIQIQCEHSKSCTDIICICFRSFARSLTLHSERKYWGGFFILHRSKKIGNIFGSMFLQRRIKFSVAIRLLKNTLLSHLIPFKNELFLSLDGSLVWNLTLFSWDDVYDYTWVRSDSINNEIRQLIWMQGFGRLFKEDSSIVWRKALV